MNIHEYQGKELFRKYGIPVPKGVPAFTVPEAVAAAKQLISETKNEVVVVKEDGRYVIDDVVLSGIGQFNPPGRLSTNLASRGE